MCMVYYIFVSIKSVVVDLEVIVVLVCYGVSGG